MVQASHRQTSSIFPLRPPGSDVLVKYNENELSLYDQVVVYTTSMFFVGGVFWVPALYTWALRRLNRIPKDQRKRRAVYGALLLSATAFFAAGPHRNKKAGEWVRVRKWGLWKSWLRFFAFEIVADQGFESIKKLINEKAIVAVSPHGVFPFGLAMAVLSDSSKSAFGKLRAVVASATQLIPWVRDVLRWVDAVDASRSAVDKALSQGSRIGIAPGGIAEMYEGYPKQGTHPDDEYTIIRKGIFRMAVKHGFPIIPVYCFGSTKLLRRLQLPYIVERISLLLRVSLVIFYGQGFLPIPFRQKLLYIMGRPIYPSSQIDSHKYNSPNSAGQFDEAVDEMLNKYCEEMIRIFDRQKESYGWAHKTLQIIRK